MYIIANAIKNLARNKGRNILLAAVTLAIILSAAIALAINGAASEVINGIRLDIGSRVEVRQDFIEMRQFGLGREDASYIPIENFYSFADSDYLRKAVWGANMYAWSGTFRAVDDEGGRPGETTRVNDDGEVALVETLKLVSTSDPEALSDFGDTREIVLGRMFGGLNECIISEEAAALNGVAPGDLIELTGAYARGKDYKLTVVGVYSDATVDYTNWFLAMNGRFADNRRNEIITSFDTLMSAGWETNLGLDLKTEYFLKDPDDVSLFEAEVRAKGLPVTYNVSINQAAYDKVAGPLAGMKNSTAVFLGVILALGAIVLALVSFLAVRERKYEIGVLRAMGMERKKVAFMMLFEAVAISALCLAVGLCAGGAMAQPVADGILSGRVAAAEAEAESSGVGNKVLFAGGQMQTDDSAAGYTPESEIRVSLGAGAVIQIAVVALGLAALTGAVGVASITRYEPLKILSERS